MADDDKQKKGPLKPYVVVLGSLVHDGKTVELGGVIKLTSADAAGLIKAGVIEPAENKK